MDEDEEADDDDDDDDEEEEDEEMEEDDDDDDEVCVALVSIFDAPFLAPLPWLPLNHADRCFLFVMCSQDESGEKIDPGAIVGRRTRGVRVDYTSKEALAKAGLHGNEIDEEEDEEMRG